MVRRPTNAALLALQPIYFATASHISLEATHTSRTALAHNPHHRGEPLEPVGKP
jgi:hypothetical protein